MLFFLFFIANIEQTIVLFLRILRILMEVFTCHNLALLLFGHSYFHCENLFPAFPSPEFK